jgi:hypothetical protein
VPEPLRPRLWAPEPGVAGRLGPAFAAAFCVVPALVWRHTHPLPFFHQEWVAFLLGSAIAGVLVAQGRWPGTGLPRIVAVPALLAAVLLVQAASGMHAYPQQTLAGVLYLLWAAVMAQAGAYLRDTVGPRVLAGTLAMALVFGASASALAGILQYSGASAAFAPMVMPAVSARVYGNLAQPNLYADYLGLGLASLVYLYVQGRLGWRACTVLAGPMLLAMAMSASRTGWLAVLVPGALALTMRFPVDGSAVEQERSLRRACAALVVGFVAAHIVLAAVPGPGSSLPFGRVAGSPEGLHERLAVWWDACRIAFASPLGGAGFGQFAYARFGLVDASAVQGAPGLFTHAHNVVLHLLAEFGVPVTGATLWLVWTWWSRLRSVPASREQWWMLSVLGIVAVHSLVEYPLWHALFLGLAALVAGAADPGRIALSNRPVKIVAVAALGLAVATLANTWTAYKVVERLHAGPQGVAAPGVLLRAAANIDVHTIFLPYLEQAYTTLVRIERQDLAPALEHNTRVLRFAPDAEVAHRQALLLALSGDAPAALRTWRAARALFPGYAERIEPLLAELVRRDPAVFGPLLRSGG